MSDLSTIFALKPIEDFGVDKHEEFVASPVEEIQRVWTRRVKRTLWLDVTAANLRLTTSHHHYQRSFQQAAILLVAGHHSDVEQEAKDEQKAKEDDQLSLRIPGAFTPSTQLLRIWQDNASVFLAGGEPKIPVGDVEAARQFSAALTSIIGSVGQAWRYSSTYKGSRQASTGGRFDPIMQLDLCEGFLVVPDRASEFLTLLHRELVEYLRSGSTISGAWGKLRLENRSDIVYSLSKPNFRKEPHFERAREL